MIQWVKHWSEIAYMALICVFQEIRGEEPDCVPCWKCETMRVLILCWFTAILAFGVREAFLYLKELF